MLDTSTIYRRKRGGFLVHSDRDAIDLDEPYAFLRTAPWAQGMTRAGLERSLRHSLCFSLQEGNRQIGLARVITDYATYAYLCDIYVIESHRGRGLGSWLVRCALKHPAINSLKRIALITHDAKEFYARLGFQPPADPEQYMERIP